MVPWVDQMLKEWGGWVRRETNGIGYPGESIEYRMMRMNARRSKSGKKDRVVSTVYKRKIVDADGKERTEAIKPMVPHPQPKDSYNKWNNEILWPAEIEKIDVIVTKLPHEYRRVVKSRYIDNGNYAEKSAALGMSKSSFFRTLDGAHRIIAMVGLSG